MRKKERYEKILAWFSIIRKSKFPQNPKRSVRFSGKGTKRSVQKKESTQHSKSRNKRFVMTSVSAL